MVVAVATWEEVAAVDMDQEVVVEIPVATTTEVEEETVAVVAEDQGK